MKAMSVEEMISRYEISEVTFGANKGKIAIHNAKRLIKDGRQDEVKARKDEILAYFKAQRDAEEAEYNARQAKINAIEGLAEIEANEAELRSWHNELNRKMESPDGVLSMRGCPKDMVAELEERYPRAAAYRKARRDANSANYEISAIGRKAVERIINGEDYSAVLADMESEMDKFTLSHAWD